MWNPQHVVTVVDRVITLPAAVQQTVRLDDAVVKTTVGARTRSASSIPDWRGWRSSWTMRLKLSFSGLLLLLLPADRKKQARAPCIIARGRRAAAHVACSGWTSSDVRRRSYRLDEHSFKFGYSWPVTQTRYFITTSIPISGFNLPKRSDYNSSFGIDHTNGSLSASCVPLFVLSVSFWWSHVHVREAGTDMHSLLVAKSV